MEQTNNKLDWTRVAEVELVYKTKIKASERPKITTSKDCYELLLNLWNDGKMELQEEFKVLLLDRSSRVKDLYEASMGGITGTVADPKAHFSSRFKISFCRIGIEPQSSIGQPDAKPCR